MSAARDEAATAAAAAVERRWVAFTTELARNEDLVATLLARHGDDGRGMCRGCTTGGTGARETAWPCSLHAMASAAARVAARRPAHRGGRGLPADLVIVDEVLDGPAAAPPS